MKCQVTIYYYNLADVTFRIKCSSYAQDFPFPAFPLLLQPSIYVQFSLPSSQQLKGCSVRRSKLCQRGIQCLLRTLTILLLRNQMKIVYKIAMIWMICR